MLKKCLSIVSVVILLGWFHGSIAKTTERIQFAKGKNTAVVKGVTGEQGVYYVISGKGGKNLVIFLTPSAKIGIKIEAERSYGHAVLLDEKNGGTYEVGLEENGDCTIFISSTEHKSIPFELSVKFTKLADI